MASKVRIKIKLVSTAGTGHYYTTTKNPRNAAAAQDEKKGSKLILKKYDPVVRKYVEYKEGKIK